MPSTTPSEVHTSVSRCCASALSVIERNLRPARKSTSATTAVDRRRDERDGEAEPHVLKWLRVHQPVPRRNPDPGRSDDYQGALQPAREILRLVVAEGVLLVRRTHREGQRPQRRHRGDEVDHGLGRVGEETDGPRKIIGPELEPYGSHRGRDGEHSVAARRPAVRQRSLSSPRASPGETRHREPARASVNVGIAASTSTFYHLPDKPNHRLDDTPLCAGERTD